MTTAAGPTFTAGYRADGLRAWKAYGGSRTYFLYDRGEPVVELDASGAVSAVNLFAPDGLVGRQAAGGGWAYCLFDADGNVAQRTDGSGGVYSATTYDGYGAVAQSPGVTPSDPFGYHARQGYYTDRETGLVYCRNRYYDPGTGRWMTRDPIGASGGINVYGYCASGPVGWVDPDGEKYGALIGGIAGALVGTVAGPAGVVGLAAGGALIGSLLDGDDPEDAAKAGASTYLDVGLAETVGDPDLLLGDFNCGLASEMEGEAEESTCFAAGTKVVMADGSTKAVEDVKKGDRVESRSEKSDEHGEVAASVVQDEFELHAPSTLLLRFEDGATVEVTAVHPIYAVGRGFTPAGELRVGDRVAEDQDGRVAVLRSIVRLGVPKPVYNLTVGGTHTYFVRAGSDDLWVHNAGPCSTVTPGRRTHILDGDATGGGHGFGRGKPNKSEFPPHWSDNDVISEIESVANDPSSSRTPGRRGRTVVRGTRGFIDIEAILGGPTEDPIITGYPTNVPRNPP